MRDEIKKESDTEAQNLYAEISGELAKQNRDVLKFALFIRKFKDGSKRRHELQDIYSGKVKRLRKIKR